MNELLTGIDDVLRHIEERLHEPLVLDDLAARTGYSAYHFHRLISAMIGQPLMRYVRRRRLSQAAARLLRSDDRILDIALDCQFESQEAFTRAFRDQHGLTPGRFRSRGTSTDTMQFPITIQDVMARIARENLMDLQPRTEHRDALTVVGMSLRVDDEAKTAGKIPQLWHDFMQRVNEVPNAIWPVTYGLSICEERHVDASVPGPGTPGAPDFIYVAAIGVPADTTDDAIPAGMQRYVLPAGEHAVFTHKGHISSIGATFDAIFGSWFPASDHQPGTTPEYEIYDERFNASTGDGDVDIVVPLRAN